MVALGEVEILFYRGVGRQRGRGFGALAQFIRKIAIPFLKNYLVPAARRIGADMLGFAVREIADLVSGNQKFKAAAGNVGRQTLKENNSGGGRRKRSASKIIQPKLKK